MMRCCFDKRVWTGLGVLAAGLLVFGPHVGWVALLGLAGLACPLSMLVTMRGMRQDAACTQDPESGQDDAGRAAEIALLRREIELFKQHASGPAVASADDPAAAAREILAPSRRDRDGGSLG